jgi:macrolide-specific efflux system membrane fusion protein
VEVKRDTIEYAIHGTGTMESRSMTYVQVEAAGGTVDEVFVKAGDEVRAGDLLLLLEQENLDLDLLKKRLDVYKKEKALHDVRENGNELELKIAMLELEIAREELNKLEERLNATRIYAPTDGVVVYDSRVEPGDRVSQYQVLYTIADPSDLWIAFTTPLESARREVQVGARAEVRLNDEVYIGTVVQTPASAPFVDHERLKEKYGNTIFIEVPELPKDVKLGDSADTKIVLHRKDDAIVLPSRALRQSFGRTYVQILEGEARREVDVETGLQTQSQVEIVKGLEIGQLVVMP